MRAVQRGPLLGLVALVALLGALAATVGLGTRGWVVGLVCGAGLCVLLLRAQHRAGTTRLGPADRVTLARAQLACAVAALVASPAQGAGRVVVVAVAALALALDNVDGRVARRTGTVSALGARFDMEVDAFLILVLSVDVSRTTGVWVLAIGLARYAYVAAGWVLPWLRGPVPFRYWCKVVAAVQGVVLTVTAAHVLPAGVTTAAVAVALVLLAESFGRDVWWLWRRRERVQRPRVRAVVTGLAVLLLWAALVLPDGGPLRAGVLARVPVEAIALLALAVLLPLTAARLVAVVAGLALAVLTLLRGLDTGFSLALGRPFEPLSDWAYVGSAHRLLRSSTGRDVTTLVTVGAVAVLVGLLALLPLAAVRVARVASARRATALRVVAGLAAVWTGSALLGLPIASAAATETAVRHVRQIDGALDDGRRFSQAVADDPWRAVPSSELLTGLADHDVLLVFVESYGRVALDGPASAPVRTALADDTDAMQRNGYAIRSGFLTSPTFGGISWLAHSTLQSGLRVGDQRRYDQLLRTDRFTLSRAFGQAGWRTVDDVPSNTGPWPEGERFYGYDRVYGAGDVGYRGPRFGYATMPDQYVLQAFQRLELDPAPRRPVMAEIDLVSSHTPWAPLPRMVEPSAVGDGSVFGPVAAQGPTAQQVWRDQHQVRAAYAQSVVYSWDALTSFLQHSTDPDLVVVALGDHQPATVVSGAGASHQVPVSLLARDPAIADRVASWGWTSSLLPADDAPVWPMEAFRDRFLTAFSR
ncbi:hypothetical protein GCM10027446_22830 [Angustibacter peucedani]